MESAATRMPATVEVQSVSRQGLPTVRLIQRVDGVEVLRTRWSRPPSRRTTACSRSPGNCSPAPARAAARGAAAGTAVSEEAAIARAASDLTGMAYEARDFTPADAPPDSGPYRFYEFTATLGDGGYARAVPAPCPAEGRDVPAGRRRVRPGLLHGALDEWLSRVQLRHRCRRRAGRAVPQEPDLARAPFTYRVHNTGDACSGPRTGRRPARPHPTGMPDGFQAPTIAEKLVKLESLLPGRPWLPAEAHRPPGNNCIAYADLKAPDGFGTGDVLRQGHGAATSSTTPTTTPSRRSDRQQPAEQPRRDVLPRQLAARPLVRGGLRRGRPATRRQTTSAAAASAATRSWPRATTSAAPTTRTCRPRPTAPARGCRCSSSWAEPQAQPHQQPRGADHLPRDGPLHHQPAGRQRHRA